MRAKNVDDSLNSVFVEKHFFRIFENFSFDREYLVYLAYFEYFVNCEKKMYFNITVPGKIFF